MSHTKEPWKLSATEHIVASDKYVVAVDCKPEDARRIVACVNACAGFSNQTLESGPDSVFIFAGDMNRQRDELLAALERLSFAATCRDNTMGDQCRLIEVRFELSAANEQAIAAIASVKGGA